MTSIRELLRKWHAHTPTGKAQARDKEVRRELSARDVLWESLVANRITTAK